MERLLALSRLLAQARSWHPVVSRTIRRFWGHQFAVEPTLQGRDIGSALMSWAESWAPDRGYSQLAVDTAESAHHLIAYYAKRGYRFVEFAQWPGKCYRSVVYSKELPMSGRGDR
jgi:GNAT superfamily N-acetyltransferase